MKTVNYDRVQQNVGNVLALEHINVAVTDQIKATVFYVMGLGFTRDPYRSFGIDNMWVNLGSQQMHLPTRPAPQVLPGHIGIAVSDLKALAGRLRLIEDRLAGTKFEWSQQSNYVEVICPWGNCFRCYLADDQLGTNKQGIILVNFATDLGVSGGIARFYEQVIGCHVEINEGSSKVFVGRGQSLHFVEKQEPKLEYDGHHIAIYLANFSGPYEFLREKGLITEETDMHQYRFQELIDPRDGQHLFTLEHEVRSLFHPLYARNLINRDSE